jgi:hypothetical protein
MVTATAGSSESWLMLFPCTMLFSLKGLPRVSFSEYISSYILLITAVPMEVTCERQKHFYSTFQSYVILIYCVTNNQVLKGVEILGK